MITLQDQFGKYRRHHQRITRYVAGRLAARDRDAVDDLVQDASWDAIADPDLFSDDVVGCMMRLAARACTRHAWVLRTTMIVDVRLNPASHTDFEGLG